MTIRRVVGALTLWLAFMGAHAFAQYPPSEVTSRDFQARVLAIGETQKALYPTAWRNAHNGSEPSGTEFVRRWALQLRAQGYTVCVNGKRGSETLSQDVLAFPVTEGWARDTSGRYRGRIMVVDVIVGAGASNARIDFGPDTSGADGRCIDPYLEPSEGGSTPTPPAPGTGPGTPAPPATEPPGPDENEIRFRVLDAKLDALLVAVDDMKNQQAADTDQIGKWMVEQAGGVVSSVGDVHVTIEALSKWLRSRRALGF